MRVAAAQLAPSYMHREATIDVVLDAMGTAAADGARLIVFPETFVPGYPSWADFTHASAFDDATQKAAYSIYLDNAIDVARGDLDTVVADLDLDMVRAERQNFDSAGSGQRRRRGTHDDGRSAHRLVQRPDPRRRDARWVDVAPVAALRAAVARAAIERGFPGPVTDGRGCTARFGNVGFSRTTLFDQRDGS